MAPSPPVCAYAIPKCDDIKYIADEDQNTIHIAIIESSGLLFRKLHKDVNLFIIAIVKIIL